MAQTVDQKAKTQLAKLLADLEPIINEHLENMDGEVMDHLLSTYPKYLKLNIEPYIKQARSQRGAADFDSLFGNSG